VNKEYFSAEKGKKHNDLSLDTVNCMVQQLKKDGEKAAANLADAELQDKERNLMQLEHCKNEKEVLVGEKTALVKRIEILVNGKDNEVFCKKIENSAVLEVPSGILVLLGCTLLLVLRL
jgi:hypothetical protein